jgi:hypothetical protein
MKIFITDIWMKKVGELPPHHGLLPFYYTDMVMRALQQRKIMPAIDLFFFLTKQVIYIDVMNVVFLLGGVDNHVVLGTIYVVTDATH